MHSDPNSPLTACQLFIMRPRDLAPAHLLMLAGRGSGGGAVVGSVMVYGDVLCLVWHE